MPVLSATRAIAALAFPVTLPLFALQQASLSLDEVRDPIVRLEIGQLGPYPEMHRPVEASALQEVPLRSGSALLSEFAADGIRVRIEAQPFPHPAWVKGNTRQGFRLERSPILGWSPGEGHTRLSRVELVLDGLVTEVPEAAFTDLFDPRLCEPGPIAPLRFATAARSADGWRVYVLAQIGQGDQALLVTWVFEDGRYLYRVVDPFRTNG